MPPSDPRMPRMISNGLSSISSTSRPSASFSMRMARSRYSVSRYFCHRSAASSTCPSMPTTPALDISVLPEARDQRGQHPTRAAERVAPVRDAEVVEKQEVTWLPVEALRLGVDRRAHLPHRRIRDLAAIAEPARIGL